MSFYGNNSLLAGTMRRIHPEAQGWYNTVIASGGTVSEQTFTAVSDFCRSIDAAGIRDRFYRLNLLCGNSDSLLIAPRVPLYRSPNPTGTPRGFAIDTNQNFVQGDYAERNSPSGGLKGNATTKALRLGTNILSGLNTSNLHMAVYGTDLAATNVNVEGYLIGVRDTEAPQRIPLARLRGGNNNAASSVFDSNEFTNTAGRAVAGAASIATGFLVGSTIANNDIAIYGNGTLLNRGTAQRTETAAPVNNIAVFGEANFNGNVFSTAISGARLRAYSVGAGLTASQVAAYRTAMVAFQTALERA